MAKGQCFIYHYEDHADDKGRCPILESKFKPGEHDLVGDALYNTIYPEVAPADEAVTVGDLKSKARGTGARKSAGKPQWFQIPWWALRGALFVYRANLEAMDIDAGALSLTRRLDRVINTMADWQRNFGDRRDGPGLIDTALAETLHLLQRASMVSLDDELRKSPLMPLAALIDVAAVLEFGAIKYPFCEPGLALGQDKRPSPASAGNWAKGMPWSTAFSCVMSHLLKRAAGSTFDEESGKDHLAHVAVNLLFLSAYRDLYPEGDDRIKTFELPNAIERKVVLNPRSFGAAYGHVHGYADVVGPAMIHENCEPCRQATQQIEEACR